MKILICDNDPSDGNELAKNLQEQNTDFEVTVTSDWARVVDDIYTYKPDIVLMDLFWHCRNASSEDIERVGKRIENVRKEIKHIKGRYVGADKTVIDSGIRALIEIRRARSKTDLPVLILTRFGNFLLDPGSKDIAYALGSGFLYKWDDTITQIHKIYNAVGRPTLLGKRIFIGHGHSKQWEQLRDFLRDERLPWDEFNRESPVGFETLSHLETKLSNAAFAILVMTVDEERSDKPVYARPNVIHEAGLFQGRLGLSRTAIMLEEGCEKFSNIHGLNHIPFPNGRIEEAFQEVIGVLEREKLYPPPEG